jgi:beta-glucanase (GH16 family)
MPDPAKWKYEVGMIRNNEKQYYTRERRENVRVEDGCLVIEARKERFEIPDKPGTFADYTAASVETRGAGEWKYGRVEVRAKIPTGRGMWPAIWMLPDSISKLGWPACGEIDIMENVGYDPTFIHGTVHTKAYNHVKKTEKGTKIDVGKPWEDFHVYAIEWSAQKIDFFFDGRLYYTFQNEGKTMDEWPFDQPFYLKINTAVGGNWGGQKGIDDSAFPSKFYVDYVRVYQAP